MHKVREEKFRKRISENLDGKILSEPVDSPPLDGACVGFDVSLWFPNFEKETATRETYKQAQENTQRAIEICTSCARRLECLAYGLQNEAWGIWGGVTERGRKSLRRQFNIPLKRRDAVINIQGMNIR